MQINSPEFDLICNEVLSHIEIREARLLNWGFIQGMQQLDWLPEALPAILDGLSTRIGKFSNDVGKIEVEDVIQNLENRKLIFNNGKGLFRSRFAETVRLMYLLRQRFSDDDCQTGARLVGDMKILLRHRRFPAWNIDVDTLLRSIPALTVLQKNVIHLLVQNDRLARFQADAIKQQLASLNQNADSAIVIGAGTGSGKTRAFYIPALAHVSQNKLVKDFVQAIALYPRVELLKDQLREIYKESRKLDNLLTDAGIQPIRIGVYYNSVLRSVGDVDYPDRMRERGWRRTRESNGWICPYMLCPNCGHDVLAWHDIEIEQEKLNNAQGSYGVHEILECVDCKTIIRGDVMPLTRKHLLLKPPDILFTTTETLNRRLGDASEHHLFGVGVQHPPRLLLMDEIHLNEGFHGAQVSYLLRRWRHARGIRTGLCIVGLSATLSQADTFFSRLTGISNVSYISPLETDLTNEGLEYNIVLKGDPVAGTTLLSTAVRVIMLLGRTLDPMDVASVSRGAWGQRIFAFSDKLDAINRWYHILKEVENPRQPYAQWHSLDRKKISPDVWRTRNVMGQNWWMISEIDKRALNTGLLLDLTSSQYRGVDPNANVVVASSTLEVGYNDPKVGAVVQHKSPYGQASFLQRKGRAGRPHSMRPWMVVVTSNYGRDRWAFQHAESLFDPILSPMDLPLENYYVRKIQAVYALIDWLSLKLHGMGHSDSLWTLLSSESPYQQLNQHNFARSQVYNLLFQLLSEPSLQSEAYSYVSEALQIHEEHVLNLLFWGKPRAIMLDVVPTILRQLGNNWQSLHFDNDVWSAHQWTDNISELPLPEFLPASLFSDLNLPDVWIQIPKRPQYRNEPREIRSRETLGLALAMLEFAPGKVNKRFADKDRISEAHWISVPETSDPQNIVDIHDLSIRFAQDTYVVQREIDSITVYRPQIYDLQLVPTYIRPTSNAFHQWSSYFIARNRRYILTNTTGISDLGRKLSLEPDSTWTKALPDIRVYTHTNNLWAEVTRYVDHTEVYTRFDHGGERRRNISYASEGQSAAIGFTIDVDAIYFTAAPINSAELLNNPAWPSIYRQIKPLFFRYKLQHELPHLTYFEIDWLWQIEMSMLVERASSLGISLEASANVVHGDLINIANRNLHLMFDNDSTVDHEETLETSEDQSQFISSIISKFGDPNIAEVLHRNCRVLWDQNDPELTNYLQELYLYSLGSLVFSAIVEMMPDVEADDLHLDVKSDGFWISELTAGGIGLVSRIADTIELNPYQFERFLRYAMTFCEREYLANDLDQIADLVSTPELSKCFQSIRHAADLPQIEHLQQSLATVLRQFGITPNRNLIVSLNTRFLRPNSDSDTDLLIKNLVNFWREQEERLGCMIDVRVIATVAAQNISIQDQVKGVLQRVSSTDEVYEASRVLNVLQSLLWVSCHDSCPDCLEKEHRYQESKKASRSLLITVLGFQRQAVTFGSQNWEKDALDTIVQKQRVLIECTDLQLADVHDELVRWISKPIETDYIVAYPNLTRVEHQESKYYFELTLSELAEAL